ncbi:MAG TPA: hypothetical protein VGF20_01070 [Candidatus Acidoferrum sp.]|jgi:hypothetical protein
MYITGPAPAKQNSCAPTTRSATSALRSNSRDSAKRQPHSLTSSVFVYSMNGRPAWSMPPTSMAIFSAFAPLFAGALCRVNRCSFLIRRLGLYGHPKNPRTLRTELQAA